MSKIKYKYNPKTLTYERVVLSWKDRFFKYTSFLISASVFAIVVILIAYQIIDSPKEKKLLRELDAMELQYDLLDKKMTQLQTVLNDMQERDNNLYRAVFEAEPLPKELRESKALEIHEYKKFENLTHSELLKEISEKIDRITKQIYIQSKSYDELVQLAQGKEEMIQCIPAIMPINKKFLKGPPSGYGMRTHPIYKTAKLHQGMDFSARVGTPIYATGDGKIERADSHAEGYGNHVVVDHGFGYKTLYAHMIKIATAAGKKIKRGELIGYVGSTGLSTGPHVHYEVIKKGEKLNPINFYYNDLTPEEYQSLLQLASNSSQTLD